MTDDADATQVSRLVYGLGAIGISLVYQSLGTLLIYYYTNVVGLTGARAGLVVFVSALWDGLADPLIAWAASHTRSRLGQYRPWLIYASVPLGLMFIMIFWRPDLPQRFVFGYVLATSLVFRSLFQAVYLPFGALIGHISGDAAERTRLAGWKAAFTSAGQTATSIFGLALVGWLGGGNDRNGFFRMACAFAPLIGLSLLATGIFTRERAGSADWPDQDTRKILVAARLMLQNRPMLHLFGAVIFFGAGYVLLASLTIHLFQYGLGNRDAARWALTAMSASGLVAAPIWSLIAIRRGKRFVWIAGAGGAAACTTVLYVSNPSSVASVVVFYWLTGFCLQVLPLLEFAALADTVDYGEWQSGARVSAFGFGTMTLLLKIALALGGGAAGMVLGLIGFTASGRHTELMLSELRAGALLLPALAFAISALLMVGYELSSEMHLCRRKDIADSHARLR